MTEDETRERELKSLRFEMRDEQAAEDARVATAVMVDMAAMVRTGKLTRELSGAEVTLSRDFYAPALELRLANGETLTVQVQRVVNRPPLEEAAEAAYEAGRRPVKERDW